VTTPCSPRAATVGKRCPEPVRREHVPCARAGGRCLHALVRALINVFARTTRALTDTSAGPITPRLNGRRRSAAWCVPGASGAPGGGEGLRALRAPICTSILVPRHPNSDGVASKRPRMAVFLHFPKLAPGAHNRLAPPGGEPWGPEGRRRRLVHTWALCPGAS